MAVLSAAWSKKNLVNDKAGAIAGFFYMGFVGECRA